jgi:hypothetical protein
MSVVNIPGPFWFFSSFYEDGEAVPASITITLKASNFLSRLFGFSARSAFFMMTPGEALLVLYAARETLRVRQGQLDPEYLAACSEAGYRLYETEGLLGEIIRVNEAALKVAPNALWMIDF